MILALVAYKLKEKKRVINIQNGSYFENIIL
jgi:hypothetical protein